MSQKIFFLLAAMLVSSLAAAQTAATGVIAGVVLERGSGQPVADADVRVADQQVTAGTPLAVSAALEKTPNFLDRVQVTATKEPVSVGNVAAPTDLIDRATLESRGDRTLTQAVAHVPGAIISTQLGIFESVMLRGLPRGDPEFTNTLLLVDGVPQTTSSNGSRVIGLTINDAS